MKRRATTIVISLGMALVLAACSTGTGGTAAVGNPLTQTNGWVDSDLIGAVTADTEYRLQDDFAAAVNKEWKLSVGNQYHNVLQKTSDSVMEKMKWAVTDTSIPGEEAEVLRKYYALSSDWDYRNSQGAEPLKPYIEDIASIGSIEELYAFFGDLDRNPLGLAPLAIKIEDVSHIEKYPDVNLTKLVLPMLSLTDSSGQTHYDGITSAATLDFYEGVENEVIYLLGRMGYSEREAKKIFHNCLKWEKRCMRRAYRSVMMNWKNT